MEPGELIRTERENRKWSQKKLADLVGISQVAIKKIEAGDTQRTKFMPKIAQVLQIDIEKLDSSLQQQSQSQNQAAERQPFVAGRPDFEVYASAEGGPGEIIRSSEPVDFIPRPTHLVHVRDAYGLMVTGTSMEPEYKAGEMAIVEPSMPIVAGEVYIFYAERHGEARATIKHLRRSTADRWLVSQHNPPEGMSADFSLSKKEWAVAHRVTGKRTRR